MFEPSYNITLSILRDTALIEAARQLIDNASLIPAWERQFQEEAMIRQTYHSTHIEGNKLSFTEAQKVFLEGQQAKVIGRDRDIQEIINYRNVIKYINEHQSLELNEATLLQMHQVIVDKLLDESQAGQYRQVQVAIINNHTQEVVFQPPTSTAVPGLVQHFFTWLQSSEAQLIPAPLKAGILHYELVRIHPFVDGNGRTARVMATLLLYKEGYDIRQFFSLDEYYDQDAATYYRSLQSANETGQLTEWLEYFIHGLAVEFNRVKERVIELSRDHALKSKLGRISLTDRQVKLLKFMESHDRIANTDWQQLIPGVSDDTILRDLKDLIKKKLVKKRGKTKASYYVLTS
jgi:Fic family protein